MAVIAKQLGLPVKLKLLSSYKDIVAELIVGKVHFARLGGFSYITAASLNPSIQPFAVHYHESNPPFQKEGAFYQSILIVHADTPYYDVQSLRGASTLLTEEGSTSGVLVPRILFSKHVKTELDEFFSLVNYSGGHDTSILEIANQRFDSAFVSARNLSLLSNKGTVNPDKFRILWESPPIPHGPYVYNTDLCEKYQKVIRETTLNLHHTETGQDMLKTLGALRLVPAKTQDYDVIQELSQLRH
jgi:phosphonate transport system substrate-binding protein